MKSHRQKDWFRGKGLIQLLKNDSIIREYRYNDPYHRRRICKIWISELKPNGKDCYELIIKPD
jgi:hypothetical protein